MEKRKLYKKYSGVCLSEGEYKNLENTGCIPNNLGNVFHGIWISESINKGYLKGTVIDDICSTDAKMFLEDWDAGNDRFGSDHTAAFVFQELFVIVAEPKLNLQNSFDPLPDVLPIAIPLRRIKDVSSEKYVGWYKMNIKFDDGSSYTAITGRFDSYDNAYIYAYAIGRQRNAEFSVKAYDYIANASTPLKPVTHDSAIIGGLVSSLSGPVVGVVAAAKTEASNAAAKASYEEAKANSHQIKATAYDNQNKSLADAKYYGNIVQKIKNKLCDTNNTEKYYEYLNCTVSKYSIEDDGSMSIIVETSFSKEPKIGEMAISIDGSLHILIQKEGKVVGDGYLCADGFNNTDLSNVGFKNDKQYYVIGLPMQTEFDVKEKYDIEIEPINIWAIEI